MSFLSFLHALWHPPAATPSEPARPGLPRYGDPMVYKGQCYFYRRQQPHTRRNGKVTSLMVWETVCPECSAAFEVETFNTKTRPRRRCDACKTARKPVVMKGARS